MSVLHRLWCYISSGGGTRVHATGGQPDLRALYATTVQTEQIAGMLKLLETMRLQVGSCALTCAESLFMLLAFCCCRQMHVLVRELDPQHNYCAHLQKVVTLSGDVLWLCKHHADQHRRA